MSFCKNIRLVLAAGVLALSSVSLLEAQDNGRRDVTLVQLDTPGDRPAMVYRRTSGSDRDVIALVPSATIDDLTRAFRVLDAMHARFGATPERDIAAAVRSETAPTSPDPQAATRRKNHGDYLNALRGADRREVKGFGAVKSIRISVVDRAGRG